MRHASPKTLTSRVIAVGLVVLVLAVVAIAMVLLYQARR